MRGDPRVPQLVVTRMCRNRPWLLASWDFVQLVRVCPRPRRGRRGCAGGLRGGSGGLQRGDPRWCGDAGGGQDLALGVGEAGGLLQRAGRAGERDDVQAL